MAALAYNDIVGKELHGDVDARLAAGWVERGDLQVDAVGVSACSVKFRVVDAAAAVCLPALVRHALPFNGELILCGLYRLSSFSGLRLPGFLGRTGLRLGQTFVPGLFLGGGCLGLLLLLCVCN